MRRHQKREMSHFAAGIVGIVLVLLATYFGFSKAIPFRSHYEVKGAFNSVNNVKPNSPVRIAGVNVGKVTKVEHLGANRQAGVITMRIEDKGRPIHEDARLAIRPRIFLEGNFFVDLRPGSPSAPVLDDGEMIPANQTAAPVQIDQILSTLQTDTRKDLKTLLKGLAEGFAGEGGKGFNRSIEYWGDAYKYSALVNDATLGIEDRDLSNYVKSAGRVVEALDRDPAALKALITDFNTTAAAFAREDENLERTIAELPRALRNGRPALKALNDSFPAVRRLIRDFRPAVRSSGPALEASLPFAKQARGLVSKNELRGLTRDLRPTVPSLARLQTDSKALFEPVRAVASCQSEVFVPFSLDKIEDPNFPAHGKVFQETPRGFPGVAGESRSTNGNGQAFRVLLNTGNYAYPLQEASGNNRFFLTTFPLQGVNPPKPAKRPPLRPNVPCETQERPDLRTIPGDPPAGFRVNQSGERFESRLAKAQAAAVSWLRRKVRDAGLGDTVKVSSDALSLEQINKLKDQLGTLTQRRPR